jgi:hypothetical protein
VIRGAGVRVEQWQRVGIEVPVCPPEAVEAEHLRGQQRWMLVEPVVGQLDLHRQHHGVVHGPRVLDLLEGDLERRRLLEGSDGCGWLWRSHRTWGGRGDLLGAGGGGCCSAFALAWPMGKEKVGAAWEDAAPGKRGGNEGDKVVGWRVWGEALRGQL